MVVYLLWWGVALIVNKPILPLPHCALTYFIKILPTQLWHHILISLYRVASAIGIALFFGMPVGLLIGRNKEIDQVISPIIYIIHPIPKIAFLPVMMLLFGLGNATKILMIAMIIFFIIVITGRDAGKNIDKQVYYSLIAMGANEWQIYRHVIIPASLPALFTMLRITIGTAIAVLFFTETFGTSQGIGYFIINAWARINYEEMFAGIIGLSLIGLMLYVIVDLLERQICKWKRV